jgi:glycogen(starch) synthase
MKLANPLPAISVVINTLNRAASLAQTLDSFRWQTYRGSFEIIVVNGPSTDDSDKVIASWQPKIRAGHCPEPNLSMSRNIGIAMAQGDIVAFIDDDGIPEPEWLEQIARAFQDAEVGGAGGRVFNHTGYEFQAEYCLTDRLGNADDWSYRRPMPQRSFPGSFQFPHLLGTNAAFRRKALLDVGGFDEEFEYFLDETDVCLRLIDAGWVIRQLSDAYVHHKFAPSTVRTETKVLKHRYPVMKNKIYFTLKHAQDYLPLERVFEEQERFIEKQRGDLRWCVENGYLGKDDETKFESDVARALQIGRARGMEGPRAMLGPQLLAEHKGAFRAFPTFAQAGVKTIVLVTQDYPPDHGGGIATFNRDLGVALAALGHRVHVVCQSKDINRVDFENGVWVHRMLPAVHELTPGAREWAVPAHIWNWSATALQEVRRIAGHRRVDVVETPIWDCQGAAFMLEGTWPLVVSLQTSLKFFLDGHPELSGDRRWMADFGTPMLKLEAELMRKANAIRAISSAIRRDIERAYGFAFPDEQVIVAPLGLAALPKGRPLPPEPKRCTLLFVGRLEYRKGIDVLLQIIPDLLAAEPGLYVRIVGEDGGGYRKAFESKLGSRVTFTGKIDDAALQAEYAGCDLFVSPSRYESFGLIFLEAMREGKAVIGCDVGGMPEIIAAEETGLLVPPGDVAALAAAILRLVRQPELRSRMGARGRELFFERFSAEAMAKSSLDLYALAMTRPPYHQKFKISYVNGICVRHDAISAALRGEMLALMARGHHDIKLYTYKCDFPELPHQIVGSPDEIARDPHFQASDLVIFHFGIYSPLFDLLPKLPAGKKKLVEFHNITAREALAPKDHAMYEQSLAQLRTISAADAVLCASETNLNVLRQEGVVVPAHAVPLAVHLPGGAPDAKPSFKDGEIRILFLGRMVRAKGPQDLLAALPAGDVRVDLVGNKNFSDPDLIAELQASFKGEAHFHFDASEAAKYRLLSDADLLVLPSYHEGFCVPVLEALASGCRVVTYDNSNLPAIGAGLSRLVPTGDIDALRDAVAQTIEEVSSEGWRGGGYRAFADLAASYVARFDPKKVDRDFVDFIEVWGVRPHSS